jgi:outer membrane receptor for ferrienterochelin and colicin
MNNQSKDDPSSSLLETIFRFLTRLLFPLLLSAVAICNLPTGFSLHAQSPVGSIHGKVKTKNAQGEELVPGASVKLQGHSADMPSLETTTDAEGQFEFTGLKSGEYTVTSSAQGFDATEQSVTVQTSAPVDIDIELKPETVTGSVTVAAGGAEADTTESNVPGTVSTPVLRNTPLASERFQDALPLIPGVVRGPDGLLNVKGARSYEGGVLVSNSNADDPVTGNAAIELPLEAVESVQVYDNPYSAEFGRFTGAVTSVSTRAGTNDWKYLVTNFVPRLRRRDGNTSGIESFTPRATVGGPIIKDKLYIFQSFEYRFIRTNVPSQPAPNSDTRLETFNSFTRADYTIDANNHFSATFSLFPQKFDFYNLNTFIPQDSTANLHQRNWSLDLNEQAVLTNGSFLDSRFSVRQVDADVFGNGDAFARPFTISPDGESGAWFDRQHRNSRRYEWRETYSLPAISWRGSHSLKFGTEVSHNRFDGIDIGSPLRVVRQDGTASQIWSFSGDGRLNRSSVELGAFVQDKWTINPRLTLDAGLRVDHSSLTSGANIAPRLGFVALPFHDTKTVLRGGVGLFYSKVPLNVGAFEQYQSILITHYGLDGATLTGSQFLAPTIVGEEKLSSPRSTAWNVQLDRELTSRLLVRAEYQDRRTSRNFLLNPYLATSGIGALLLSNDGAARYREFQASARLQLQKNRDLHFAYIRSRATGDLNDFGSFFGNFRQAIIRQNEYGRLAFDTPNRLLFWGDIGLPHGVTFSPVVDWRDGFPFSAVDADQNFVGSRNQAGRYPAFTSADAQVTKDITIPFRGKEYRTRIGFKVFNITNHWNPRDVQSNIASQNFGTFYNSIGRVFRLKFEVLSF